MTEMPPIDELARELDEQDELAELRSEFVIDDPSLIYLDGHSLGRLPKRTLRNIDQVVQQQWGRQLIRSWNTSWFEVSRRIGGKIARLIGAQENEVVVADSTSLNLYKLAAATLQARPDRRQLMTDAENFPSDIYILEGLQRWGSPPCELRVLPVRQGEHFAPDAFSTAISEQTGLVALSHVSYQSGLLHDMRSLTQLAHQRGAWMLWDLCHTIGVVPMDVQQSAADMAIGCTYKYLNGGPGAPAFLYVREALHDTLLNPIWGWFGSRNQFEFSKHYRPADGVSRFQVGTPPILSLCALEGGVDVVLEAGVQRIREKAMRLSQYLQSLWKQWLEPLGFSWNSPANAADRGAHVALGHAEAWRITQALIHDMQVILDFRAPQTIRWGLSPLYISFSELYQAVLRTRRVVNERRFEKYSQECGDVT